MPHGEAQTEVSHHNQHGGLSQSGDFDPEQAAMLQDLARNGAPEESHMYGYPEAGFHGVQLGSYGDGPLNGMQENGLLQGQQDIDLDDPAALLESLASFEHPPSSNNAPISNNHFASLLQAAATAGGQEAGHIDAGQTSRSTRQSKAAKQLRVRYTSPTNGRNKNKRLDGAEAQSFAARGSKRKHVLDESDDAEQLALEHEIWGSEEEEEGEEESAFLMEYDHPPVGVSDARAAGVHSAMALFRRPSAASKKYTRPPMSKLFTSLELSPEQFLQLQGAAKSYMLDPDHPERRDCVGSRGRADTDMVKLKLFGCVRSFLEDEAWGNNCWGESSEGADIRKLKWPQMKNKIISLVTPLLRRMVTNERQRQYAIEARTKSHRAFGRRVVSRRTSREPAGSTQEYPEIDPKLDEYQYNLEQNLTADSYTTQAAKQQRPIAEPTHTDTQMEEAHTLIEGPTISYHVNILHTSRRVRPRLNLTPLACPNFASLVQHIHNLLASDDVPPKDIRVLCPEGLVEVTDNKTWGYAVERVTAADWMDGVVKVVVQVSCPQGNE